MNKRLSVVESVHASNPSCHTKVCHCLPLVLQGSTHLIKKQSGFYTKHSSLMAFITAALLSIATSVSIKHDQEFPFFAYPAVLIHQ